MSWYCCQTHRLISAPVVTVSPFQVGGMSSSQEASLKGVVSFWKPLPLKRIVSGTQIPGRPPMYFLVHASRLGRFGR